MMNEIIKERLALIQSGTVPQGYKKTKFGIYPENWTLTCMGNCIREYREISNNIQEIPVYSSSRNGLLPQSEYYDGKEATQTNIGYKVVPPNYLTYRHMSDDDIFHFNMNQTGGNILVSSEYPVFTVSDIAELGFILPVLNNAPRFKYFCGMQKLGGTRTRLYFKNLCAYQFYIPPLAEQKKIVEILAQFDKVIELKQQLILEMQQMKKGFLRAMFPAKGHNTPDIRFWGFSDPWEQRKLENMTSLITKGTTPVDKSGMGSVNFIKIESIDPSTGEITITSKISEDEHNGYLRRSQLQENDILFSIAGTLGRVTTINRAILPANTNQALAIIRLKSECLLYITTYLKGKAVADFIKRNPTVGAQPNLSLEQVGNLNIALPSIAEQNQIGAFFHNFDHLITLYQRELEEKKKMKSSLMQLLLSGIVRVKP